MEYTINPGIRSGKVRIPSSKSYAHRLLICSALSGEKTDIDCYGISKDITATADCMRALGADISIGDNNIIAVNPIAACENSSLQEGDGSDFDKELKHLYCGESGSTLRFLIPVVGALGVNGVFHMEGRLSTRPLDDLLNELEKHGMSFNKEGDLLYCSGQLTAGAYSIPGNISSQYISGLLFALPILMGDSTLEVTNTIESKAYIEMTEDIIMSMEVSLVKEGNNYKIPGNQKYKAPDYSLVESDWSNAAFFLCMGAMSKEGISMNAMNLSSKQGDKKIIEILKGFGANVIIDGDVITVKADKLMGQTIDASEIPDLVPTISALASVAQGTTNIVNAARLRFKESDRLNSTANMINNIGGRVTETEDGLIIEGVQSLKGGTVDSVNDHRIAMASAVAACGSKGNVKVLDSGCIAKSYPNFWIDLESLEVTDEQ
ncbi:MAG: 3-phosphoshikimate 1-carboxyvinyltransferase [Lachnospiraceae bacterium]|nr:3-phosphoshikimate 1-carboxyvinyltransferase [Lachnospiraceae bacterium]